MNDFTFLKSSRSYRHLIDGGYFVDVNGNNIAEEQILNRYIAAFTDTQELIKKYSIMDCCTINPDILWRAILDFFEDIARLKHFHGHTDPLADKEYAYEVFWHLRNRPIQITDPDKLPLQYIHINEFIYTKWLIIKLAVELESRFTPNIQIDMLSEKLETHELLIEYSRKLYYTFRHRMYTPQTLLLSIEGFMTGAEFTLQIT